MMEPFFNFLQFPIMQTASGPLTVAAAFTTMAGAFIFVFVVAICWGRFVETFGPIGGFMAGFFIVGTIWILDHKLAGFYPALGLAPGVVEEGIKQGMHNDQYGLIFQSGGAWIDMGYAAGFGLWVESLCSGAKFGTSIQRGLVLLLGGILGGLAVGAVTFAGNGAGFGANPSIKAEINAKHAAAVAPATSSEEALEIPVMPENAE